MPKPSLRELFEQYNDPLSCYSIWVYDLLEALVEAVEPEDTPTIEQYNEARDAIIRKLRKERDERAILAVGSKIMLADARESRDRLRKKLAETKAELEALGELCDGYRADWGKELRRRERLILAKVAACNAEEAMRADAEIGRLVLDMAPGASLTRLFGIPGYVAATRWQKGKYSDKRTTGHRDDPTEALRAIQEVGDAEA